ncbi:ABC transporter substrate-binding protein [Pseudorhodoplanes sp.]|uniref:ABC transporter substrate-binding protein n=1 Tax=Pseudorhodoplanes sp. TaxID=1934341 RepID=UPI003D127374
MLRLASTVFCAALLSSAFIDRLNAQQGVTDAEIVIGEVEPLTGPPALLGVAASLGTKIAVAEINAAGGINGRKIRYVLEDDGYVSARTIQGLRKIIDVDKVFAILGLSGSGQTLAALPILEKSGLPTVLTVAPTNPVWQPPRKNVFAVGQDYAEGIRVVVRYLADKNPKKKWGIITQDDDYGLAVREGFESIVKERNLDVVFNATYRRGQQDFSAEILRLKEAGVEVFMMGGIITENVAMIKEMEKLGIKPTIGVFWPGRLEIVLKLMGPASHGIIAVDYVNPFASVEGQTFLAKAKQFLPESDLKSINRYSMVGYAGAMVLFDAIKRCGRNVTAACVNNELEKTKDLQTGVMAPVTFGPGVRFSGQKLQVMEADFPTLSFKPAP